MKTVHQKEQNISQSEDEFIITSIMDYLDYLSETFVRHPTVGGGCFTCRRYFFYGLPATFEALGQFRLNTNEPILNCGRKLEFSEKTHTCLRRTTPD